LDLDKGAFEHLLDNAIESSPLANIRRIVIKLSIHVLMRITFSADKHSFVKGSTNLRRRLDTIFILCLLRVNWFTIISKNNRSWLLEFIALPSTVDNSS
jgi:hypothetical protein